MNAVELAHQARGKDFRATAIDNLELEIRTRQEAAKILELAEELFDVLDQGGVMYTVTTKLLTPEICNSNTSIELRIRTGGPPIVSLRLENTRNAAPTCLLVSTNERAKIGLEAGAKLVAKHWIESQDRRLEDRITQIVQKEGLNHNG